MAKAAWAEWSQRFVSFFCSFVGSLSPAAEPALTSLRWQFWGFLHCTGDWFQGLMWNLAQHALCCVKFYVYRSMFCGFHPSKTSKKNCGLPCSVGNGKSWSIFCCSLCLMLGPEPETGLRYAQFKGYFVAIYCSILLQFSPFFRGRTSLSNCMHNLDCR